MTRQRAYRRESDLVKDVVQRIKDEAPNAHAWKVHGSRYQPAGEPDVDGVVEGRAVKVECKLPGAEPTPLQYASMRRWQRAGALSGWVTSIEELDWLLEHLGEAEWSNPQLERENRSS